VLPPPAFEQPIYVTRPLLPAFDVYAASVRGVWERQWLTNKGPLHDQLEKALCKYLRTPNLSLVSSGTTALTLAFRAFELSGEVITTPLTSPATVNAIAWCGLTPVFADIDPISLTIDPTAVARAITPQTVAIVPVHLYGMPCKVDELKDIAEYRNVRLIYDAAHAFGTEIGGTPILSFGDASILSFHATKLFNTAEGGGVAVRDDDIKQRIDVLKTLGIVDETTVALPGINGRMNELSAALGLSNLSLIDAERSGRAKVADVYRSRLTGKLGLSFVNIPDRVRNSPQYFVIRIHNETCSISRDALCERLKEFNVFARRYFYPPCNEFTFYRNLPSSDPNNLKIATRIAREVVALPLYGALGTTAAHRICDIIDYLLKK
jgi:dTDP-4-amino-4,6-dideoxygalactose transaminase